MGAHDINNRMALLRRQYDRADEAANVMAQPVAWATVNDHNPETTWEEGRQDAIKQLREMARLANEIADDAETLPPWQG